MAEHRRFPDLNYGHAGQLTYIPREHAGDGPGELHTTRLTSNLPNFSLAGPYYEVYPPSLPPAPQATTQLWQARRRQKRWLLSSHPEAFVGISAFEQTLSEDMKRFRKSEVTPSNRPLLAMGLMTDVRKRMARTGIPVLASATGQSGEILRITRIQESQWQWDQNDDALLNLSTIDPEDREEEVTWASDGLPIGQIKFATSYSRQSPVRWLIVQRETSTVVLQPTYHAVPISESRIGESHQQSPSRISPNPILTLSHHQTGGNAHSDVAFNPGSKDRPPQLIVIDECGYWTVWNIFGLSHVAKHSFRPSLLKCGHLWEGLLNEVPRFSARPAEKHGILVVGETDTEGFWDVSKLDKATFAVPSRRILAWNRERFEIYDTELDTFLPRISNFVAAKGGADWILDILPSPIDRDHVFVLTTRFLFWIDISCRLTGRGNSSAPKVLLACPVSASGHNDQRMTVCRPLHDAQRTSMVFVYSTRAKQLSTYWFTQSSKNEMPQWYRHIIALPGSSDNSSRFDLDLLRIYPAELHAFSDAQKTGIGSVYQQRGVQFFQGSFLGVDLSVRYCVFASCTDPRLEVTLPTTRIGWTQPEQEKRWSKKRRQFVRHIASTFVLPDEMADWDLDTLVRPHQEMDAPRSSEENTSARKAHPVRLRLGSIGAVLNTSLVELERQSSARLSATMLDAVRTMLENGISDGSLPLMTWQEATIEFGVPFEVGESTDAPEEAVQSLFDLASEEVIIQQLRRRSPKEASDVLESFPSLKHYFSSLWLAPVADKLPGNLQQRRRAWVEELARDLFMSTCGIMVQDVPLLGPASSEAALESQRSMPSSVSILPSTPTSREITSSPPVTSSYSAPDAAFQRLQLLAPSLRAGKLGDVKQASILSYWPTERGIDTKDYISSIAVASDKQFDESRERLRKREAKRKAQEKFKRPAFMRQGFPSEERRKDEQLGTQPGPAQILSSQVVPPSSQIQGQPVTMSQPVAGAFGDRKKVKKGKKKSGFR